MLQVDVNYHISYKFGYIYIYFVETVWLVTKIYWLLSMHINLHVLKNWVEMVDKSNLIQTSVHFKSIAYSIIQNKMF